MLNSQDVSISLDKLSTHIKHLIYAKHPKFQVYSKLVYPANRDNKKIRVLIGDQLCIDFCVCSDWSGAIAFQHKCHVTMELSTGVKCLETLKLVKTVKVLHQNTELMMSYARNTLIDV